MSKCTKCGTNFVGAPEAMPPDGLCRYCQIDIFKAVLLYVQRRTTDSRTQQVIEMTLRGKDPTDVLRNEAAPVRTKAVLDATQHGVSCHKVLHISGIQTGWSHESSDDTPYDVDGVKYCGRCHEYLP